MGGRDEDRAYNSVSPGWAAGLWYFAPPGG